MMQNHQKIYLSIYDLKSLENSNLI